MLHITPQGTPSKRLNYLPVEIASTTPKPLKGAKHPAILNTSQKVRVTGKDIQKSVQAKCPTVDTDRLMKRQMSLAGRNESLIAECPPESPPAEKNRDFLSSLKNVKTPLLVKQIDISF